MNTSHFVPSLDLLNVFGQVPKMVKIQAFFDEHKSDGSETWLAMKQGQYDSGNSD